MPVTGTLRCSAPGGPVLCTATRCTEIVHKHRNRRPSPRHSRQSDGMSFPTPIVPDAMLPQPDWVGTARMSLHNAADVMRSVAIALNSVAADTNWKAPGMSNLHEYIQGAASDANVVVTMLYTEASDLGAWR